MDGSSVVYSAKTNRKTMAAAVLLQKKSLPHPAAVWLS
jgi:hypothetical protein